MSLRTALLFALALASPARGQEHDPPPPPPAPAPQGALPGPIPNQAADVVIDSADEGPELQRYQACFQKMIDAGVADNAFMKKCLGIDGRAKKPTGPLAPLSRDEVRDGLLAATPDLETCYNRLISTWKVAGQKPAGSMTFTFSAAKGVAKDVSFQGGLSDATLTTCFAERLKKLTFRKTEADAPGVSAKWRLSFRNKSGTRGLVELQDKDGLKLLGAAYGLPPDDVLTVFRKNAPKVRRCYDDLVKRKPDAAGSAAVTLNVSAKGKVTKVQFRELTVGDDAFKSCATRELKSWRFPHPRSGDEVRVDYPPFEFRAK